MGDKMEEINILYIEDDLLSFYFIKTLCHRKIDKNVKFIQACNGAEAMEKIRNENIHLILLDYSLPDVNGLELMEKIREESKEIPIVMITGWGDEKVATEAMKKGAIDYIAKWGENINELAKCLKTYIDLASQLSIGMYIKYEEIKKKRDAISIIHCLLRNAIGGIKKTKLLYKTNLNSKTLEKYLNYCIKQGYVQVRGENRMYVITEKGMEALKKIEEVSKLLA